MKILCCAIQKVQKWSWNKPYSSFTKLSCSKMALYRWIKTESRWSRKLRWFLCHFPIEQKACDVIIIIIVIIFWRRYWIPREWKNYAYAVRTHTHSRLTALFPGLPRWAGTRKVISIWILMKQETVSGSGISWAICKSAPCSRQITMPCPTAQFFTGRVPFLPPNQQRQSTEGTLCNTKMYKNPAVIIIIIISIIIIK